MWQIVYIGIRKQDIKLFVYLRRIFDYGLKYMFGLNSSMRYKLMLLSFIPVIAENSQLVSFAKKHPYIICAMSMISVPFFRAFRKYRQLKKS